MTLNPTNLPPPTRWVVLGAGGHARSVSALIAGLNGTVVAIAEEPTGEWADSVRVFSSDQEAIDLALLEASGIAFGISSNAARSVLYSHAADSDFHPSLVSLP